MVLPKIAVVIPTIDGREEHFRRCLSAYTETAADSYRIELHVALNQPTCGWGWQHGIERLSSDYDYLHLTCDDIEPMPGWADGAIDAIGHHYLPAPRILNGVTGEPESFPHWGTDWPDGTPAGLSALPFMSRKLWEESVAPMLTSHYYGDNWCTWRAAAAGYPAIVTRRYSFKHYWATHRRGAGMGYEERLASDQGIFLAAVKMVQRGEWKEPWPRLEDS